VIIVVLEDMETRINWLRSTYPEAEIVWHTTVKGFVACLESGIKPTLVIFDHDLDTADPNARPGQLHDVDGLTGADAARMMPELDCFAVVWSANPVGARSIARHAASKVSGAVLMAPFTISKSQLKAGIDAALRSAPLPPDVGLFGGTP